MTTRVIFVNGLRYLRQLRALPSFNYPRANFANVIAANFFSVGRACFASVGRSHFVNSDVCASSTSTCLLRQRAYVVFVNKCARGLIKARGVRKTTVERARSSSAAMYAFGQSVYGFGVARCEREI